MSTTTSKRPRRRGLRAIAALGATALLIPLMTMIGAQSATAASTRHGLQGDYFTMSTPGARDFVDHKATILESRIELPGLEATFKDLTGQSQNTTARWTGQIEAPATDAYTFYAIGDNGFRLWIDGKIVIDHWEPDWDNEQTSAPVTLNAGQRYDFKLEMFQDSGGANMYLRWSSGSIAKSIVPDSAFWVPDGFSYFEGAAAIPAEGTTVRLTTPGNVTGGKGLADHVRVSVADDDWPITNVAVDPSDPKTLVFTLEFPITKGAGVRLIYDGKGDMTVGGDASDSFNLPVTNGSEYSMVTPFAADMDPSNPLPEYPRPQMTRTAWKNLNGPWQFSPALGSDPVPFGQTLPETITVPFPVESLLSGIQRHEDEMFYRRTVEVPTDWKIGSDNRLLLQFGAIDFESWIYVNGTEVNHHRGGFDAFAVDITGAVTASGPQEIIVRVKDTTDRTYPTGKQVPSPGGIFYTPASGIWQTVWMEPVPKVASIDDVVSVPAKSLDAVNVKVKAAKASGSATVKVTAKDKSGAVVDEKTGKANADIKLDIPDAKLWEPGSPYLYDLSATLTDGGATDVAESYFGMRTIDVGLVDGKNHILLNGKKTFLMSTLDQGYWPDGIFTAPTDEALKFDLDEHIVMGFNTVRKHIKVEPARWYHHADQLGLMVWQDQPSAWPRNNMAARQFFEDDLATMVDSHMSSPSIIGWVPFNEGWGEWDLNDTGRIADGVKAQDPSRIVNAHSGANCCDSLGDSGKGDIIDGHAYPGPWIQEPDATRASIDGEHGGFSLAAPGHMWPGGSLNPYQAVENSAALTKAYVRNTSELIRPAQCAMSGSIYTQITDVENELNGFWTYDRAVSKIDRDAVRAINEKVIEVGARTGASTYPPGKPGLDGTAYWPLDENEGTTILDRSGAGHHGTIVNDPAWTSGKYGSGLHFNGSNQWANGGNDILDTTGNYTVSAWVTLDKIPDNYATIVSEDGASGKSSFFLQYGKPVGGFAMSFAGGPRAVVKMTPELNTWYHIVGVRDAATGELRIYVNGELGASTEACGADLNGGALAIGRGQWESKAVDYWNGNIDEVRTFDRALSGAEITELFNKVPAPIATPEVKVVPDKAAPGHIIGIEGSNLAAGETVSAIIDPGASGSVVRPDVTVGADGKATWSWTIPAGFPDGSHDVAITSTGGVELARTSFTVDSSLPPVAGPKLVISPSTVAQGAELTVSGEGFPVGTPLTVTVNSTPVVIGTPTADVAGGFSLNWTVPADFEIGTHTVTAADGQGLVNVSVNVSVVAKVTPPVDPGTNPPGPVDPGKPMDPGKVPGAGGKLPVTGSSPLPWVGLGVSLIAMGGAAVLVVRRKGLWPAK